jgi:hypothetical protein
MPNGKKRSSSLNEWIILWFNWAEDTIYVGLGLLLAAIALTLLVTEVIYFRRYITTATLAENIVFYSTASFL